MRFMARAIVPMILCTVLVAGEGLAAAKGADRGRGERTVLGDLDLRTPWGKQVSLIPLVGSKAIVVVFWTSGCTRCGADVRRLNELNSHRLTKVVAVNEGESMNAIEAFARKHDVGYDVVVDPKGAVARAFGVPGTPSCVIISRSGLIVYRGEWLPEEIEYYIAQ